MTSLNRLAFIGNSLPRRCGIATFTTDLRDAITHASPHIETAIIAMTDHGRTYDYPSSVRFQIRDNHLQDYIDTASALNAGRFDVVSLQHEFGIFGGEAGSHLMALLSRLNMPVVTTFHTVLAEPSRAQRDVMARVTEASSRVVVMANKAKDLLQAVYRVRPDKIEVIPHGIPDVPLVGSAVAKAKLGFTGRSVILTFGLLSPNKGIEVMIDAMPSIVARHPDTTYVVLGATHPNLVREQGETYRQTLIARTRERGVEHNVCFLDQFVGQATLLDFISSCDVYVTPYLNEAQMTSGTLAYSFGCGRPVVSTPYWHAQELLKDGQGVLVPFGNSNAIGEAMDDLLRDDRRRSAMGQNAYAASRTMTWLSTADRYLDAFTSATRGQRVSVLPRTVPNVSSQSTRALPPLQTGHFLSMCDDTGLFQHAVHAVPDRSHGYCIDDNARALLLSCALNSSPETRLPVDVSSRFNSFIQHAWNRGLGRFRNFMSFDRRWLEEQGSEDSHGRTLWAVGECSRSGGSDAERAWAKRLFAEAVPAALSFKSPRSWAFSLLGLNAYCEITPDDRNSDQVRLILADRLVSQFMAAATVDWPWFETGLAYDNARLSQALIDTGVHLKNASYLDMGLKSLTWLTKMQVSDGGIFRPVGTAGFHDICKPPRHFDQQPLEASATVSACLAAWHADADGFWTDEAFRAFAWFRGTNDLNVSLIDETTGACRDGLHSDRPNENCGGESAVSYLLSLAELRRFAVLQDETQVPVAVRAWRV